MTMTSFILHSPFKKGRILLLGICVAIGIAVSWYFGNRLESLPVIELDGVHPAVRRAIESAFNDVVAQRRSGYCWGRLGMVLSAHEFHSASIDCFRNAVRRDKVDARWPYLLGVGMETIDPKASVDAYREAIQRDPTLVSAKIRLVEVLFQLDSLDAAESILNEILSQVPDDPRVNYRMAQLLMRRGRTDEAFAAVERAFAAAPRKKVIAELRTQLRHALNQRLKQRDDLIGNELAGATETGWHDPILDEVAALRRDPYWRAAKANAMIQSGQINEGIRELEHAADDADNDWTLQSNLVRAYIKENRLDEAERRLTRSLAKHTGSVDLIRLRGSVHLLRRQWSEAIDDYRQAIQRKQDDAQSYSDLGYCLQQTGDFPAALRAYQESLRLEPRLDAARIQLGKQLLQSGDLNGAAEAAKAILLNDPNHAEAKRVLEQATSRP